MTPSTTTAEAIVSVEPLIARAARSISRDPHDQLDIASQLREHLLTRAWPAFDPAKSHWPRFAQVCVARKATNIIRARQRAKRKAHSRLAASPPAPDYAHDNRVLALAEQIRQSPGEFFRGLDARAVLAVLDPDSPEAANVPAKLVSSTKYKMRQRIRRLAEQTFE